MGATRPESPEWKRGGVPSLPLALSIVIALLVAVAAASFAALHRSTVAQERLLEIEATALAATRAAEAASQARARLAHEALLTPTAGMVATAEAAYGTLRERLAVVRRLAASPDDRALVDRIEAEQEETLQLWRELIAARRRGEPIDALAALWSQRIQPLRVLLDRDYEALAAAHEAELARGRAEAARVGRRATRGLVAAASLALVVAVVMTVLLRRSLRALVESEVRYRDTFEHAAVGIANVALDGRFLRVNRRFEDILGYSEAELRAMRFRDVTHPDDVGETEALARRLIAGEVPVYALEKRYLRKDGRPTWVFLTVALVRDREGNPRHFVSAAEPIDQRKAVEEELREAVRARDEFLHIASHELRTPLTSLGLQLDGLRAAVAPTKALDRERINAKAEVARRQVRRLGALVSELLDVSRIAEGEVLVEAEDADLVASARAVAERLGADAARAGSALRIVAPDTVHARFDPVRVEQALTHLVANALKYGAGKPVDLVVQRDGATARVLVRDRGIGIEPAARERIFDRFERAVSSRHYGGLGLGLFLARRIVEAHGGTIAVDSTPGEGSTFSVELPVAGPRQAAAGA